MIPVYVELSRESPALAEAELRAAVAVLGGSPGEAGGAGLIRVELPGPTAAVALAGRLALARRCLCPVRPGETVAAALSAEGASGAAAAVRRLGGSGSGSDESVRAAGRAYRDGGGRIDLERPERRFWLTDGAGAVPRLLEEVAAVDRSAIARRRMPLLPFQRPVSLPPRLARAAANLARAGPGDRVIDPFLGTGALLGEAALLGSAVVGIDRDPGMIRGALRNFAHLGVTPSRLVEGESGSVDGDGLEGPYAAVLTDPPYGRSSSTGGEPSADLLRRVLPRWADRVCADGRVVLVVPTGTPDPLPGWEREVAVGVRVHRSLTREFRAYRRAN